MTPVYSAVTGAFGFSGKYIAKLLAHRGEKVLTLTNSAPHQNEFDDQINISPYHFNEPAKLVEALRGVSVLYNTYWVRFNYTASQRSDAVRNTLTLFNAAKEAGIQRIVHTSITNADEHSPLAYFAEKGMAEKALINSGISYAILRPAVLFGEEDILINNIAWMLRRFPALGIFGNGDYQLQPIFVGDFARIAVEQGSLKENVILDAIGPETFTYSELVKTISRIILGYERKTFCMPDELGYWMLKVIGAIMGDKLATRDEIKGLKANLLCTSSLPVGSTKFTHWLTEHAATIGMVYANELKKRQTTTTYTK